MKELKRIILIALRCVDPDVENRPTIGDVIHMLEPRDLLLDDVSNISLYQSIIDNTFVTTLSLHYKITYYDSIISSFVQNIYYKIVCILMQDSVIDV